MRRREEKGSESDTRRANIIEIKSTQAVVGTGSIVNHIIDLIVRVPKTYSFFVLYEFYPFLFPFRLVFSLIILLNYDLCDMCYVLICNAALNLT